MTMTSFLKSVHSSAGYRLFILWMIYYPLVATIFSLIWAGPIAAAERTAYLNAFYFELQLFTASIVPLGSWSPPDATSGTYALINLLAVAHQIIFSIFIGISAGPMIEQLLAIKGPSFLARVDPDGSLLVPRTKLGFFLKLILFYLIIVAFFVFWAIYWGGFMALAEGWPFNDGFVTALGVITSGLTVLQPDKFPITGWGVFCGFYLGVMGAAMLGLTIALSSVPLLGIDLSYDDSPVVRIFPLLILSKEQRDRIYNKESTEGDEEAK